MGELQDLEVVEISIVDRPANKRDPLFFKSDATKTDMENELDESNFEKTDKFDDLLEQKDFDERQELKLRATLRALESLQKDLSDGDYEDVTKSIFGNGISKSSDETITASEIAESLSESAADELSEKIEELQSKKADGDTDEEKEGVDKQSQLGEWILSNLGEDQDQNDLEEAVDRSPSTIDSIIRGEITPSGEVLRGIADFFDVSVETIVNQLPSGEQETAMDRLEEENSEEKSEETKEEEEDQQEKDKSEGEPQGSTDEQEKSEEDEGEDIEKDEDQDEGDSLGDLDLGDLEDLSKDDDKFQELPDAVQEKIESIWKSQKQKRQEIEKEKEQLQEELEEKRKEVEKQQKKQAIRKEEERAEERFPKLKGESEDIAPLMYELKQFDEDLYEKVDDRLKAANDQVEESGFYDEAGTSETPDNPDDPQEALKQKAEELQKSSEEDLTYEQAFREAVTNNPELYNEYTKQRG